MGRWSIFGVALAVAGVTACSAEPAVGVSSDDVRQVEVVELTVGSSQVLDLASGASYVFRVPTAPDSGWAAVMRTTDGDIDSYLRLYPEREGFRIAESTYLQAALPMARETDAVIVHHAEVAEDLLLFLADLDLEGAGTFQLDVVPLTTAKPRVSLTGAGPGQLAWMASLREDEPEVSRRLDEGALREEPDGRLAVALTAVPLAERPSVNALAARVNDAREGLFDTWVSDDASRGDVATVCSELWQSLRADAHRLGR